MDRWKTLAIQCKGGLNTSTDTLSYQPGEATQLTNYEPGIYGGYRRISGYQPFDTNKANSSGAVLGVCIYNGGPTATSYVLACSATNVYTSTGSGWSSIASRATTNRYMFTKYFNGNTRIVTMCDGTNAAAKWDGTSYTLINGSGAPTNPKYATFFNGCLVLSGYTSGGGLECFSLSVPNEDTNFAGVSGAIEINVHDQINAIRSFRGTLYIFCTRSIYQLTGTDTTTYAISPVATGIGCLAYDSIQECNGDLVYLSADGIRTLSGTMKLNDTELGDLSKPIIDIASSVWVNAGSNPDNISSCIVRAKNQYRLFYRPQSNSASVNYGIIGAIRPGKQTMTQFGTYISYWEWSVIQGITPNCCDSDFFGGSEHVVHGGLDGFVYQQEKGTSFNGSNIYSVFTTPPLQLEDPETRKLIQKLSIYCHNEGGTNVITVQALFDLGSNFVAQPLPVLAHSATLMPTYVYGTALYGSAMYSVDFVPEFLANVTGSGKLVQFQFVTNDTNASHSIQGLALQYRPLGRR